MACRIVRMPGPSAAGYAQQHPPTPPRPYP